MSTFNDLLTASQATMQALSLQWNGTAIPIMVSEQPLNREVIDPTPLPVVWLTPPSTMGERVDQLATGNLMEVVYPIEFSIVASGNAQLEVNLPSYLDLREQIRKAFQRIVFPSVPGMWFVAPKPKQVLNTDLQRDNYDLSILTIEFTVAELAVKS